MFAFQVSSVHSGWQVDDLTKRYEKGNYEKQYVVPKLREYNQRIRYVLVQSVHKLNKNEMIRLEKGF